MIQSSLESSSQTLSPLPVFFCSGTCVLHGINKLFALSFEALRYSSRFAIARHCRRTEKQKERKRDEIRDEKDTSSYLQNHIHDILVFSSHRPVAPKSPFCSSASNNWDTQRYLEKYKTLQWTAYRQISYYREIHTNKPKTTRFNSHISTRREKNILSTIYTTLWYISHRRYKSIIDHWQIAIS